MQAADSRPVCRTHFNLIHIFSTLKSAGLKLRNIHIYACGIFVLIFTHTQTQTHTYELMMPSHSNILLSLFAACHFAFVWRCVYLIFLFSCITISQPFSFFNLATHPSSSHNIFWHVDAFCIFHDESISCFCYPPLFFRWGNTEFCIFLALKAVQELQTTSEMKQMCSWRNGFPKMFNGYTFLQMRPIAHLTNLKLYNVLFNKKKRPFQYFNSWSLHINLFANSHACLHTETRTFLAFIKCCNETSKPEATKKKS